MTMQLYHAAGAPGCKHAYQKFGTRDNRFWVDYCPDTSCEYQDIHLELRKANANLDRVRAQLDREELLLSKHTIRCERSSNKVEGTSVFLASSCPESTILPIRATDFELLRCFKDCNNRTRTPAIYRPGPETLVSGQELASS
jgi:hypothetical protein